MADKDYQDALETEGRDLVALASQGRLPHVYFRSEEVARVGKRLDQGRCVLLTGAPGVGKTAIVHSLAFQLAAWGGRGLRELSCTRIMSGTRYLGEWQTKLNAIVTQARETNTAIYLSDVQNLATVGRSASDPTCLLDALRPIFEAGGLLVIGEATPAVLRSMERVAGFTVHFDLVGVTPLTDEHTDVVLRSAADRASETLDEGCVAALKTLTRRFLPQRPQPGPALGLWEQVRHYRVEKDRAGETAPLTPELIERVFSIYTGLPMFVVSRAETRPASEIRAWFEDRIVGQRRAIEAVVETIALFKAGLHDPTRPIGAFLFVGPTGVGKTELARALATYLFGSPNRLLRFDMSEFKDYHAFEMLLGDPKDPLKPARLVDPVRAEPFQVVLFDELEKAHDNISDIFLQLLDAGRLTPPGGQEVNFCNTLIIATSNVGAQSAEKALGFGQSVDDASRAASVQKALEQAFRPEFLNRFQHIVVFDALTEDQLRRIARHELKRILARDGITDRNLVVDVEDAALDIVIRDGVDPRYGARSLKRELQRRIVLPLAMTLMEKRVDAGGMLRVAASAGRIRVRVLDTPASRERRRATAPIKVANRKKKTSRDEIEFELARTQRGIAALADAIAEPEMRAEQTRLDELRAQPEFWTLPGPAARTLVDLDEINHSLDRLDRLRWQHEDAVAALGESLTREQLAEVGAELVELDFALGAAERELVRMGPSGRWDALVEIRPAPGGLGRQARDLVAQTIMAWAPKNGHEIDVLHEPLSDEEPVLLAVKGPYAHGLLRREAGIHRLLDGEQHGAAAVRVGAWTDAQLDPTLGAHRALKTEGQLGGRVRSRLECGEGLTLQNARTLGENRDRAAELVGSWAQTPASPDTIVRRYDRFPPRVRDVLTGFASGKPDALSPRHFHALLLRRVDHEGE